MTINLNISGELGFHARLQYLCHRRKSTIVSVHHVYYGETFLYSEGLAVLGPSQGGIAFGSFQREDCMRADKYLRLTIALAVSSLFLGCPSTPPPPASDSSPPGFVSVLVTLETGTAPGPTAVAVGPIDLAAAAGGVARQSLPDTIGTVKVVATAGDPQSGISNLTINGTATWKCASQPGSSAGTPTVQEALKFTPTFTPSTPPSTPATLTAVATPIVESGCPVPAPAGFTRSTLQGNFTVTATSLGGSTTTQVFAFDYASF